MLQKLKEQWFIGIIALVLIGSVVFFVYDQNKDKLAGKRVDGKDVVVEINGEDIFADDLYADVDEATKNAAIYMFFERMVVSNAVETTADLKSEAKLQADQLIAAYKESYGSTYEDTLLAALKGVGYNKVSDLTDYFINTIKVTDLVRAKIDENKTELFTEIVKEKQSRLVSHILVKMEDPSNPTDEEQAKMDEIDAAIKGGMSFGDAAKEYSDDSGSAANYGSVGYTDEDTSFVTEFLKAALALDEGETSKWVKTEYGYHLIHADATTVETLLANEDISDDIYNAIDSYYPNLYYEAVWEQAEALDIQFADETLEASLKAYMGLGE
ncbi:MAG: foldase protein PrsA [Erysipelotrichaceae bacterium]